MIPRDVIQFGVGKISRTFFSTPTDSSPRVLRDLINITVFIT